MGNRIHTEVIDAWRTYGITTEVAALSATATTLTTTVQQGITVHTLPVSSNLAVKAANRVMDAIWHYPYLAGAVQSYRQLIREHTFDLVHIETSFPLGFVAFLTGRNQPPLAITLPGADIMAEPEYEYGYGRYRAVRLILSHIFRRATVLRADSPQIQTLALQLGAPPARIQAIPYNITADSFLPVTANLALFRSESRTLIAERHLLDPTRPIIVSVNRLHPFKGFIYLIEAMPILRAAGLRPQLLIVGPNRSTPQYGDYSAVLRERAESLGVAEFVYFIGAVDRAEVIRYYAAADIGVVASVAESFSRVAIETAAAGTPVVITQTTGASDYVAESGCGKIVAPRDGKAIGAALVELLTEQSVWEACHVNTVAFAERFRSERIAKDLYDLYQYVPSKSFDKPLRKC